VLGFEPTERHGSTGQPTRPAARIVPFSASGPFDGVARVLRPRLKRICLRSRMASPSELLPYRCRPFPNGRAISYSSDWRRNW
jgi:hypothetical protein